MRGPLAIAALCALAACAQPGGAAAPSAPTSPLLTGLALLKSDDPSLALGAFKRELSQNGVTPEALAGVGSSLYLLGRAGEAERFLRAAVDLNPNFAIARNNLGVVLYERGDFSGAISELQTAFAITAGLNQGIATNLGIVEVASARAGEDVFYEVDAEFDLIQYGHGAYRLKRRAEDATRAEDPT
ncbi:MAG: tetratricopeptide repeat protein [Pseudomonadota bacterium]